MSVSLGQKIRTSRKKERYRMADIADLLGVSLATMSLIETGQLKNGPTPEVVVQLANILNDNSILLHYLEVNPVYRAIIPRIFPELNNIRRDPAIIFSRFADEAQEAVEAARILAQIFSNADPRRSPNFDEVFKAKLEQIVDVQRCAEILFTGLIAAEVMTDDDQRDVHDRQQRKCIEHGHHRLIGEAV